MMGDPSMPLRDEDVKRIGDYVKPWLREVVTELVPVRSGTTDPQLLERMVRVEEELQSQRELMSERFGTMDQRFVDLQTQMDKRFDAVDRRFEAMDKRFVDLQTQMDRRFEAADRRFEAVGERFQSVDKRFDDVHESIRRTQWLIGLGFVMLTVAVTVFGLIG
jgi:hypothetical protein